MHKLRGGCIIKTLTDAELNKLQAEYSPGTRLRLIEMPDDPYPVPVGTLGTVQLVNRAGQIIMGWDNGSSLNLIIGVDKYEKV